MSQNVDCFSQDSWDSLPDLAFDNRGNLLPQQPPTEELQAGAPIPDRGTAASPNVTTSPGQSAFRVLCFFNHICTIILLLYESN